jgi:hypothetical protein
MSEEKEIIGYSIDDKIIYCVDRILKNQETVKKKIEKAITADDTGEELIFCEGCKKEIR